MKRFNKFIKSVLSDFSIPFTVFCVIIGVSIVGTFGLIFAAAGVSWVVCFIIDKPFVFAESIEPGIGILAILVGIIITIDYLRKKWHSIEVD